MVAAAEDDVGDTRAVRDHGLGQRLEGGLPIEQGDRTVVVPT